MKRASQTKSLKEKADIIRIYEKDKLTKSEVEDRYGIKRQTFDYWLKNKEKILKAVEYNDFDSSRKRMRRSNQPDVDECLFNWFRQVRSQGVPISGPLLLQKAKEFGNLLQNEEHDFSESWLQRFKARHAITNRMISGEGQSAPQDAISKWKEDLPELLLEYKPSDVYNADETGLFWQLLPNKTLAEKGDRCIGGKACKQRITLMVTANMDGSDKRPLLVIGRFEKPRCFQGVKKLPVIYKANKKSWMTSNLFVEYVRKLDEEMTKEKRKIVLFIDNCPAHPVIENLRSVRLMFFPANTTSHTQPMDGGVIRCLKAYYKKFLLTRMVCELDSGSDFKPDLLLAVSLAAQAWDSVSPVVIQNCYRHCGFITSNETTSGENSENSLPDFRNIFERMARILTPAPRVTADTFLSADELTSTCAPVNEIDIVDSVTESTSAEVVEISDEEDGQDDSVPIKPVKSSEAIAAIDTLRNFFLQNDLDTSAFNFAKLSDAVMKTSTIMTQSKITDFFRP